uniref:Uncharacterized protein n=1 Tax=Anguilla anguilla TaxID=7936 RepID=A0A0E9XDL9_ANGAN
MCYSLPRLRTREAWFRSSWPGKGVAHCTVCAVACLALARLKHELKLKYF